VPRLPGVSQGKANLPAKQRWLTDSFVATSWNHFTDKSNPKSIFCRELLRGEGPFSYGAHIPHDLGQSSERPNIGSQANVDFLYSQASEIGIRGPPQEFYLDGEPCRGGLGMVRKEPFRSTSLTACLTSAAQRISMAKPGQNPCAAAITGLTHFSMAEMAAWKSYYIRIRYTIMNK
jgi:hypothetical protein